MILTLLLAALPIIATLLMLLELHGLHTDRRGYAAAAARDEAFDRLHHISPW